MTATSALTAVLALLLSACTASSADNAKATRAAGTRIAQSVAATISVRETAGPAGTTPTPILVAVPTLGAELTPGLPSPLVSATPGDPTSVPTAGAPSPTPRPTATLCADCPFRPHFWMDRPIAPQYTDYVDPNYRYGDTQNGARDPHHGVEFQNPEGTPILAVADGTVVVSGNDWHNVYGRSLYFYGTLVVLELDQKYYDRPVYALYGHLSETTVSVGQHVRTGEMLGRVGASGVALGAHLHFEVRVGQNDYWSTRNPELWLRPLTWNGARWGAIAGVVRDKNGDLLHSYTVVVRSLDIDYEESITRYVPTYSAEGPNADDELDENFALGDLPAGTYEVAVNTTTLYKQVVVVAPGQVSFVEFNVNPPPTATPTATP